MRVIFFAFSHSFPVVAQPRTTWNHQIPVKWDHAAENVIAVYRNVAGSLGTDTSNLSSKCFENLETKFFGFRGSCKQLGGMYVPGFKMMNFDEWW